MAHDVFISYSTKDRLTANAVCATLEARGIRCWIAPRDIQPGADWGEAIITAIEGSRAMVLIFSGHANASQQIKREVERAVNKNVTVVPLRIENVPMSKSLEYFVSTPHWLDALAPPLDQHLHQLADTLQRMLNRPPDVAAPPAVGGGTAPFARGYSNPGGPGPRPVVSANPYAPAPGFGPYAAPPMGPGFGQRGPMGSGPGGYPPQFMPPKGNAAAVTSLVCGVAGCVPLLSVPAIIFGMIGLRRTREPGVGGKGLAIVGLVLGAIGVMVWGLAGFGWLLMHNQDLSARPYAQQFLQDLSAGQIQSAHGRTDDMSVQEVQALYDDKFAALGPLYGVEWAATALDTDTPSEHDRCLVKGEASFQNGKRQVRMLMRESGSKWEVTSVEVD